LPTEIVYKQIRTAHRDIYITVMDDYGSAMHLTMSVTTSATERAAKIAAAIATMDQGQTQMEACAAEEGLDLSTAKAAGLKKKAAAMKSSGIAPAPAASTPTVGEVKSA
jgi:hypothetical protein